MNYTEYAAWVKEMQSDSFVEDIKQKDVTLQVLENAMGLTTGRWHKSFELMFAEFFNAIKEQYAFGDFHQVCIIFWKGSLHSTQ